MTNRFDVKNNDSNYFSFTKHFKKKSKLISSVEKVIN